MTRADSAWTGLPSRNTWTDCATWRGLSRGLRRLDTQRWGVSAHKMAFDIFISRLVGVLSKTRNTLRGPKPEALVTR